MLSSSLVTGIVWLLMESGILRVEGTVGKVRIYLTHGTYSYLYQMKETYPEEKLTLFVKENNAALVHETPGKTLFKSGSAYEVLETIGEIQDSKFAVIRYYQVRDEGKPVFEHEAKQQLNILARAAGLAGARALQPVKGDTYAIISFWEKESDYLRFSKNHPHFPLGTDSISVLANTPYDAKYVIPQDK